MTLAVLPAAPLAAVHLTGTLINVGTVLAGTVAGTLLGERLPARVRDVVMDGLGLVTVLVGLSQGLAAFQPPLTRLVSGAAAGGVPVLIVLGSLMAGGIVGELVGNRTILGAVGDRLKRRFASGQAGSPRGSWWPRWCSASAPCRSWARSGTG